MQDSVPSFSFFFGFSYNFDVLVFLIYWRNNVVNFIWLVNVSIINGFLISHGTLKFAFLF